ncbi:MAG: outer membrane beta-barrel protein [Neomegalonema sp.]|nr:outer membrane beta-barrel protein [Neomegalonema sp.]
MKLTFAAAGAAAVVLAGGAAFAEGKDGKCFDKGTLSYIDCPKPAEPEVKVEEPAPIVDDSGFYIGARAGVALIDGEYNVGAADKRDVNHDTGFFVSGMFGYEYADVAPGISLRPEIELGYMSAEVDKITSSASGAQPAVGGDTSVFFGFVNVFADIEVIESVDLIVGGGLGFGVVNFDSHSSAGVVAMDDSDIGFGWNIGAGLGIDVAEGVKLEALYRYMSFDVETSSAAAFKGDADLDAHTVTLGLRFKF